MITECPYCGADMECAIHEDFDYQESFECDCPVCEKAVAVEAEIDITFYCYKIERQDKP